MQLFEGGDRRLCKRSVAAAFPAVLLATFLSAFPAFFGAAAWGESLPASLHLLVANDDIARSAPPSTVSFYAVGANGNLADPEPVSTDGNGIAGGYFGISRVLVIASDEDACVYA